MSIILHSSNLWNTTSETILGYEIFLIFYLFGLFIFIWETKETRKGFGEGRRGGEIVGSILGSAEIKA
jgi:hypothetical protein